MRINLRQLLIYFVGLFVLCVGVVLNTKTNLGVAAINAIPFVLSKTTTISLGTGVFIVYCILIVLQCLINQKIDLLTILQLPVSLLFGRMVDFVNVYVLPFEANSFFSGCILLLFAVNIVAIGTNLVVSQNLVPNAPDGFVQCAAKRANVSFGKAKFSVDFICVFLALILSLLLSSTIIGIGFGTVVSIVFTGMLCNFYKKILQRKE